MATDKDFTSSYNPTWCPGCGNFGIYPAIKKALVELGLEPHQVAMSFGIGCSSNGANFFNLYSFHSIHGRTIPVAVGIKLANHEMTVIADSGDGDGYGEGLNHMMHTARSNVDITYLVHDNHLYSLTKGQMSPTSLKGMKTKTTPFGALNRPFNPLSTAITAGVSFVAQGFSGDIKQLTEIIKQAIEHKGFALVNILQVCVTLNKVNTFQWFKEHTYNVADEGHEPASFSKAIEVATRNHDKLPLGVIYRSERKTYGDQLPQIEIEPLVKHPIDSIDITESLKAYR